MDAEWVRLRPDDKEDAIYVANFDAANQCLVKSGEKFEDKAVEFGLQDPGNTTCARWGDFLGEGIPGLFLCRYDQMNLLYLLQPDGSYLNIAYPSHMAEEDSTADAGWLDFDNDGRIDLVAVARSGAIYVYKNETHEISECK